MPTVVLTFSVSLKASVHIFECTSLIFLDLSLSLVLVLPGNILKLDVVCPSHSSLMDDPQRFTPDPPLSCLPFGQTFG